MRSPVVRELFRFVLPILLLAPGMALAQTTEQPSADIQQRDRVEQQLKELRDQQQALLNSMQQQVSDFNARIAAMEAEFGVAPSKDQAAQAGDLGNSACTASGLWPLGVALCLLRILAARFRRPCVPRSRASDPRQRQVAAGPERGRQHLVRSLPRCLQWVRSCCCPLSLSRLEGSTPDRSTAAGSPCCLDCRGVVGARPDPGGYAQCGRGGCGGQGPRRSGASASAPSGSPRCHLGNRGGGYLPSTRRAASAGRKNDGWVTAGSAGAEPGRMSSREPSGCLSDLERGGTDAPDRWPSSDREAEPTRGPPTPAHAANR